jgi:sugar-specific transcriptional regulator TrmB
MLKELQTLGFTKNESEVYETLVKTGTCKAGQLIAKLDIHRNIVYEALESLIRKGYATKISKRGVWWFQITEPDSILTMLRSKEQIAEEVIKQVKLQRQQTDQQITVYEGVDSYRSYWINSLERFPEGTVDYCLGVPSHSTWVELLGPDVLKKYTDLRVKKRIFWKTIHFKITNAEKELFKLYPDITEYRLWEKDFSPIGNFNIIHDTVILQVMDPIHPRIIEIRDKDMVTLFKGYFDAIWEEAKPIASK